VHGELGAAVVQAGEAGRPTGAAGAPEPALTDSLHARRDSLRASATETSTLRTEVVSQLGGVKQYFFGFVSSTFATLGGVILVLVLAIYIATEPETYHSGLMHLFPQYARRRAGVVLTAMATALRKWLLTQLIAMLAIGTVTTIVLLALGVRAAFPLGVLAGLFEFIPTIGPVLSAVPAVAMGFLDSPEKALWVALAYVGIQFLENHLLIPVLMREGVDIPPALTIIAQALMALVFGFLGLLVAVPLLAAAMVAVKMLYVEGVVGDSLEVLDAGDEEDDAG
jgi:predicted PurR-regulated permease PerM